MSDMSYMVLTETEPKWKTKDGEVLLVSEMEDSHLLNTIHYLECQAVRESYSIPAPNFRGEMAQYSSEQEYWQIADNPFVFLPDIYHVMVEEAVKRKLLPPYYQPSSGIFLERSPEEMKNILAELHPRSNRRLVDIRRRCENCTFWGGNGDLIDNATDIRKRCFGRDYYLEWRYGRDLQPSDCRDWKEK